MLIIIIIVTVQKENLEAVKRQDRLSTFPPQQRWRVVRVFMLQLLRREASWHRHWPCAIVAIHTPDPDTNTDLIPSLKCRYYMLTDINLAPSLQSTHQIMTLTVTLYNLWIVDTICWIWHWLCAIVAIHAPDPNTNSDLIPSLKCRYYILTLTLHCIPDSRF